MTQSRTLDELLAHLETMLQTSTYTDTTGNGLLVRGRSSVRCIGAALNTSFATIDAAIERGVDCLFVHHAPWASIDLDLRAPKLERLNQAGISLYAAHEALDRRATPSVGAVLARLVDLTIEREGQDDLVLGSAPSMTFDAWTALVAERLATPVRAWPNAPHFHRVAVVPGGGGSTEYLAQAIALGCDTFFTGEGSLYTELFAREQRLSLLLASHDATEFPGVCHFVGSVAAALGLDWHQIQEADFITGGGHAPIEHGRRVSSNERCS
jgi:putative NIF3 family GTP cyclohydrolase 1 type 2